MSSYNSPFCRYCLTIWTFNLSYHMKSCMTQNIFNICGNFRTETTFERISVTMTFSEMCSVFCYFSTPITTILKTAFIDKNLVIFMMGKKTIQIRPSFAAIPTRKNQFKWMFDQVMNPESILIHSFKCTIINNTFHKVLCPCRSTTNVLLRR